MLLASCLSGTISLLILVVGMHVDKRAAEFELRDVADVLEAVMGQASRVPQCSHCPLRAT